jgi:hypothetical protein
LSLYIPRIIFVVCSQRHFCHFISPHICSLQKDLKESHESIISLYKDPFPRLRNEQSALKPCQSKMPKLEIQKCSTEEDTRSFLDFFLLPWSLKSFVFQETRHWWLRCTRGVREAGVGGGAGGRRQPPANVMPALSPRPVIYCNFVLFQKFSTFHVGILTSS